MSAPERGAWKNTRIGGLMRCCLMTLWEETPLKEAPKEGDVVACNNCKESMRFRDGAWEWNNDR